MLYSGVLKKIFSGAISTLKRKVGQYIYYDVMQSVGEEEVYVQGGFVVQYAL